MIIIGATYLDVATVSTVAISASIGVQSRKVGIHWVHVFQSTSESTIS